MGIAIQIRTLSPAGGCVVIATMRQMSGLVASTIADSMVVFGSATVARLSHDRTGLAPAMSGFGGFGINAGAWAWPAAAKRIIIDAETTSVLLTLFITSSEKWALEYRGSTPCRAPWARRELSPASTVCTR